MANLNKQTEQEKKTASTDESASKKPISIPTGVTSPIKINPSTSEVNIKLTFKKGGKGGKGGKGKKDQKNVEDKKAKKETPDKKQQGENQSKNSNQSNKGDKKNEKGGKGGKGEEGGKETPDKEQEQKRQLYQQQQTARLGQKLPEQIGGKKSVGGKEKNEANGSAGASKPNETEQQRRLETEKHLAKAAAHAAAGSKTAAIKEGLSAVKSAGGAKALAGMIGQAGTAKILAWAWRIVFTGVGIIFTFFYVNFHGMMRYLVGSTTFCKFGAEWQIGGVKTKKENVMLEFAEIIVILFCDFIVFIVLSIIITFICMGFYYVKFENWFDAIKDISKTLFSIFKDFLKF